MNALKVIRRSLVAIACERHGIVTLTTALILVPMVIAAGIGIDVARVQLVEARLSQAIDAAALAAARVVGTEHAEVDVQNFFEANFPDGYLNSEISAVEMTFNERTGEVEVIARGHVKTALMRLAHIDKVDVGARAVVVRNQQPLEVALVLDVTGSMSGSKLDALKRAAKDLIEIIFSGDPDEEELAIAVVPFSARVNVGTSYRDWLDSTPTWRWRGCMEVRSGDAGVDDRPPSSEGFEPTETYTRYGWYWNRGWRYGSYQTNIPCPTRMQPLHHDRRDLERMIDGLSAGGTTRTDIGAVWGWRAISKRWYGLWDGVPDRPSRDEEEVKAVVLMTDGENVPSYSSLTRTEADERLAEICANIKADGILVFAVTFQAPSSVEPLFRSCASQPSMYFKTPSEAELRQAFRLIAGRLSELRIAQ